MNVTINGQKYKAAPTETILQVAAKNNIYIPTMCHNGNLTLTGACGICVVEVEGVKRLLRACATPALGGMVMYTNSKRVLQARKTILELMLSTHTGDCQAPCRLACSAETDCMGYIKLIAEGKTKEAVGLMKEAHPFPASLARICPRPCETSCRRKLVDEAVNIAGIKRYAADIHLQHNVEPIVEPENGKHIAIIGGGPGGLTAAYFLRRGGFKVTVYEKMPKMGGLLQYGIPEYRLPKRIIDAEIKLLEDMGITFKNNIEVLPSDIKENCDAVIIATGAHQTKPLRVKGEDSPGVIGGIDFLKAVAEGNIPTIGKKVIVVGGSNTAMDAARTARRLGAEVILSYRRTKNEMPAEEKEIEEAITEGVEFLFLTAPKEIKPGLEITLEKMTLGEQDESGRRKPVPLSGRDITLQADTIIAAIGQDASALGLDLITDENFRTNMPGIYAIGDVTGKSSYAIDAISHGRKAAASVLNTINLPWETIPQILVKDDNPKIASNQKNKKPRENEIHIHSTDFSETAQGLTAEQVQKETARCLSCGCDAYKKCELINLANKYDANPLRFSNGKKLEHNQQSGTINRDINKCIHCYQCAKACEEVGKNLFTAKSRGFECFMDTAFGQSLPPSCKDCMECVKVCPTGALT